MLGGDAAALLGFGQAQMKPASAALIALLADSEQFIMADLYTFTLVGGSLLRYSAAPSASFGQWSHFRVGPEIRAFADEGGYRHSGGRAGGQGLSGADGSDWRFAVYGSGLAGPA